MVRIFKDSKTSDFVVQTTCLDSQSFIAELAETLTLAVAKDDSGFTALGILNNAMPIAYKLSGYKAENVSEQRTLICGNLSPDACEIVATAGK